MRFRESAVLGPDGRQVLIAEPAFRGAGTGRRFAGFDAPRVGSNAALLPNLESLRARSRALIRNNPEIWSAIEVLVANHIGWGAVPSWETEDDALRDRLDIAWADSAKQMNLDAKQTQVVREVFTAGECFVRHRNRLSTDTDRHGRRLVVPYDIQVLEAEHVPLDKTEVLPNGNTIRAGIEFDRIGRVVAYWMYRTHPGDGVPVARNADVELVRVPAMSDDGVEVSHIFVREAPGQLRGIPRAARVLLTSHDLDAFGDATLQRQAIAALFAGFITTSDDRGSGSLLGETDELPEPVLEPGSMSRLGPNEAITFPSLPDTGNNLHAFVEWMHRRLASGLGCMYEQITGDLGNINFTSFRAGFLEFRRRCEMFQFTTLAPELLDPIGVRWLRRAVLAGAVSIPGFATDEVAASRVSWLFQGWKFVQPKEEGDAARGLIRDGIASKSSIIREQGGRPDQVRRERAAELKADRLAGIATDTDVERVPQPGAQAQAATPAKPDEPTGKQQRAARRAAKVAHAG